MNNENNLMIIAHDSLMNKIHTIREQKVMLDFELAEIYGYTTKRFNEQVKNNIEKFDDDFRFQLTKNEWNILRSKISASKLKEGSGGRRYLPYVFTEQGIYMLMTVLKGELAVRQSKALIRTFKQIKDYVLESQGLIGKREFLQLSMQITNNVIEIQDLQISLQNVEDKVAEVIDTLGNVVQKSDLSDVILDFSNPLVKRGYLILNGQLVEANLAYTDIYSLARKSIYIVDNYIGIKTLVLLKEVVPSVEIIIFSDNLGKGLHNIEFEDFRREYPKINVRLFKSGGVFHDRYIIIDWETDNQRIFHCGASSKDAGERITTVSEVFDQTAYAALIDELVKNPPLILK